LRAGRARGGRKDHDPPYRFVLLKLPAMLKKPRPTAAAAAGG
jgi:hypothetical protein